MCAFFAIKKGFNVNTTNNIYINNNDPLDFFSEELRIRRIIDKEQDEKLKEQVKKMKDKNYLDTLQKKLEENLQRFNITNLDFEEDLDFINIRKDIFKQINEKKNKNKSISKIQYYINDNKSTSSSSDNSSENNEINNIIVEDFKQIMIDFLNEEKEEDKNIKNQSFKSYGKEDYICFLKLIDQTKKIIEKNFAKENVSEGEYLCFFNFRNQINRIITRYFEKENDSIRNEYIDFLKIIDEKQKKFEDYIIEKYSQKESIYNRYLNLDKTYLGKKEYYSFLKLMNKIEKLKNKASYKDFLYDMNFKEQKALLDQLEKSDNNCQIIVFSKKNKKNYLISHEDTLDIIQKSDFQVLQKKTKVKHFYSYESNFSKKQ